MSDLLPSGKQHVSFSEVRNWIECGWRHYLQQIKKINLDKDSEHLDFGTAVHASCENFLKTKVMDVDISLMMIVSAWEKKKFPDVEKWAQWASDSLTEVPAFLDENFPGWETIAAEEALYENIENYNAFFKGFVDSVIKVPKANGKYEIWILDWKTAGAGGWSPEKKRDPLMHAQLSLYKYFLMKKHPELYEGAQYVKCGFVLLKKGAKEGKRVELVPVSIGPVTMEKGLKLVTNTIAGMRRGIKMKNRQSCKYCVYFETEHCS